MPLYIDKIYFSNLGKHILSNIRYFWSCWLGPIFCFTSFFLLKCYEKLDLLALHLLSNISYFWSCWLGRIFRSNPIRFFVLDIASYQAGIISYKIRTSYECLLQYKFFSLSIQRTYCTLQYNVVRLDLCSTSRSK